MRVIVTMLMILALSGCSAMLLGGDVPPPQQTADEDEKSDTVAGVLSIVAFLVALAVLGLQLMTTSKWVSQEDPVNHGSGWNALFE